MIGQCSPSSVETIEQVPTTGSFVVDTIKISAQIDSLSNIEGSGRIVYHFEHSQGAPDQLSFRVNESGVVMVVEYYSPLETNHYYPWSPKLTIQDTGGDSVIIRCAISGRFWRPDSGYEIEGTFFWSDSQRVLVVR